MHLTIVGLNHRTAPVELRERAAISPENMLVTLERLSEHESVEECAVVSTCNRTEICCVFVNDCMDASLLVHFLSTETGIEKNLLEGCTYTLTDEDAVEHLFKVCSGLDSMVLGETQIASQVKEAYSAAVSAGVTGRIMNKLFHASFKVGKRIRTETRLCEGSLSVSQAACDLAQKVFGDLSASNVLLIGAGEAGQLAARHLRERNVTKLTISNRTRERAEVLASDISGSVVDFDNIRNELRAADIIVSSTGSSEPILLADDFEPALRDRSSYLLVIDLAVPRDIDPEASKLEGLFLYNVDDLESLVEANRLSRAREAEKALKTVEEERDKFVLWHKRNQADPTIKEMQGFFETIRQKELERIKEGLSEKEFNRIDTATKSMMKKIAHHPILHVKDAATKSNARGLIESVRDILGLDGEHE